MNSLPFAPCLVDTRYGRTFKAEQVLLLVVFNEVRLSEGVLPLADNKQVQKTCLVLACRYSRHYRSVHHNRPQPPVWAVVVQPDAGAVYALSDNEWQKDLLRV